MDDRKVRRKVAASRWEWVRVEGASIDRRCYVSVSVCVWFCDGRSRQLQIGRDETRQRGSRTAKGAAGRTGLHGDDELARVYENVTRAPCATRLTVKR